MIFIDSNIPMYLVGADHENKRAAKILTERLIADRERLVTNAEVFQEILHRYHAIDRKPMVQQTFDFLIGLIDDVISVELDDVLAAKDIMLAYPKISARDALHVAHMKRHAIKKIFSFDRGFDEISWVERLGAV